MATVLNCSWREAGLPTLATWGRDGPPAVLSARHTLTRCCWREHCYPRTACRLVSYIKQINNLCRVTPRLPCLGGGDWEAGVQSCGQAQNAELRFREVGLQKPSIVLLLFSRSNGRVWDPPGQEKSLLGQVKLPQSSCVESLPNCSRGQRWAQEGTGPPGL